MRRKRRTPVNGRLRLLLLFLLIAFAVLLGRAAWLQAVQAGFFFNDTTTTQIYTLALHDALPIWPALDEGAADE